MLRPFIVKVSPVLGYFPLGVYRCITTRLVVIARIIAYLLKLKQIGILYTNIQALFYLMHSGYECTHLESSP